MQFLGLLLLISIQAYSSENLKIIEPIEKTNESPLNGAIDLQFGSPTYPKYEWATSDLYHQNGYALHIALEWIPIHTFGKWGLGLGSGFYVTPRSSNRHLYTYPIETFASFRGDFLKNQILVPFGKVGIDLTFAQEKALSGPQNSRLRKYYGLDLGVGIELCLNKIDSRTAKEFDQSIGVNNTYLVFEYLSSRPLSISANEINLTHIEYRAGLRFEY